ncbi:MAG TPA: sulfotransferase domain-containing protein [Candidatus Acidoferrales bacterium]|nr:sulfotransferase domain-containing protein [Candidatus Acidoferrales bacterium]
MRIKPSHNSNLVSYLRDIRDALFLRKPAGRFLTVAADDRFLVSYPRSGNTWTRFLIANLIQQSPVTFESIDHLIPDIYLITDRALSRIPKPRILKSHEPYDPRYPLVVYLVRDPRDALISRYYYALKWGAFSDDYPMEQFADRFVSGTADLYHRTGPWGDHVLSWIAMRAGQPNFLILRYEDLKRDMQRELTRLASFMKLEVDEARLARAIEWSSAERMRELDLKQPLDLLKSTRRDVPFVRTGVAGGWRSQLSEISVRKIELAWWPLMNLLGYETVSTFDNGSIRPQVNEELCAGLAKLGLIAPL